MPTRDQVLSLVRAGRSYEDVARELRVPAGLAYLVGTGLPADGSDVLTPEELRREGLLEGSTQHLSNPPTESPKHEETTQRWMVARAQADAPMRTAAAARTPDPPPIEGESDDVVDVLGWDHHQVEYLQKELKAEPEHPRRVSIVRMMRARLSQHEAVEQGHFWPAVRAAVPGGEELAARALEQEQQGRDLLQELSKVEDDPDRFGELAEQLDSALAKHVAFEDFVFLRFEEAVPEDVRTRIGRDVKQAKRRVEDKAA